MERADTALLYAVCLSDVYMLYAHGIGSSVRSRSRIIMDKVVFDCSNKCISVSVSVSVLVSGCNWSCPTVE